jgi:hypothetical protein
MARMLRVHGARHRHKDDEKKERANTSHVENRPQESDA